MGADSLEYAETNQNQTSAYETDNQRFLAFKTLETVAIDTPAFLEISYMVIWLLIFYLVSKGKLKYLTALL